MDKIQNVSTLSVTFMAISAFLSIVVPIGIIIWMGVKKTLNAKALFFGALLFIIFSLVLENLTHVLILGKDPTQNAIYKNIVLYMLYGGFAAGIFEETARLLGFKFLVKVSGGESLNTGISYGLGHGGVESALLGGYISISYLLTSIMVNGGMLKGTTAAMNEQQLASFNQEISVLTSSPSNVFLVVGIERVVALTLQVALSLLVFKAVRDKKWLYFIYAILIHAGVDMVAVLGQRGYISNMFVLEGIILLMTIASIVFALKVSKRVNAEQ
jgi:uncharacterized membrane protein YhfC